MLRGQLHTSTVDKSAAGLPAASTLPWSRSASSSKCHYTPSEGGLVYTPWHTYNASKPTLVKRLQQEQKPEGELVQHEQKPEGG